MTKSQRVSTKRELSRGIYRDSFSIRYIHDELLYGSLGQLVAHNMAHICLCAVYIPSRSRRVAATSARVYPFANTCTSGTDITDPPPLACIHRYAYYRPDVARHAMPDTMSRRRRRGPSRRALRVLSEARVIHVRDMSLSVPRTTVLQYIRACICVYIYICTQVPRISRTFLTHVPLCGTMDVIPGGFCSFFDHPQLVQPR